jgi:hypothetical protein
VAKLEPETYKPRLVSSSHLLASHRTTLTLDTEHIDRKYIEENRSALFVNNYRVYMVVSIISKLF